MIDFLKYRENECSATIQNWQDVYLVLNMEAFVKNAAQRRDKHCDFLIALPGNRSWKIYLVELKGKKLKDISRIDKLIEDFQEKLSGTLKILKDFLCAEERKNFFRILNLVSSGVCVKIYAILVLPEETVSRIYNRSGIFSRLKLKTGELKSSLEGIGYLEGAWISICNSDLVSPWINLR